MPTSYDTRLESSTDIAAPPEQVWSLVGDVLRMPEWSPQVDSTRLRSGFERLELGAEFTNKNSQGELEWVTHGRVVRWAPGREVAFRIEENWTVWSYTLQPYADGTRLTLRREAPDGLSDASRSSIDDWFGGPDTFAATMRDGMDRTLAAIKAAVEG
ncbi:SRPBCC family protein [Luteipulveratus halotolerans]|uniref:Polyketide cyclase n=1 Tax=Luteipulveratus halotolerans TaxID=1631356 RepID=A0A0L6CFW6_9MICO|nr:SRPBCC family protein [Luteipulveratus halotolerans]KNX36465.1 polyketide cyclase [Luteipulveratus halotolerans]